MLLRIKPDQIINEPIGEDFIPSPNEQKYYNYTENNMLTLPEGLKTTFPSIEPKPSK